MGKVTISHQKVFQLSVSDAERMDKLGINRIDTIVELMSERAFSYERLKSSTPEQRAFLSYLELRYNKEILEENTILTAGPAPDPSKGPPRWSEWLSALACEPKLRDAMMGDREEIFQKDISRFGRARAIRTYHIDTARSLWPIFCRVLRWLGSAGIGGAILHWLRH